MEPTEADVAAVKSVIRDYERDFKNTYNRQPTREDIDKDAKIRKYYKFLSKYKANKTITVSARHPLNPLDQPRADEPSQAITVSTITTAISSTITSTATTASSTHQSSATRHIWAQGLNKQQTKTVISTGDKELDRFNSVGVKLTRLTEEHYREEAKSNKQLCYSLRFKHQHLLEKSKLIKEQNKLAQAAAAAAAAEAELAEKNALDSPTVDQFIQCPETNFTSIASLDDDEPQDSFFSQPRQSFSRDPSPAPPSAMEEQPSPTVHHQKPSYVAPVIEPKPKKPQEPEPTAMSLLESLATGTATALTTSIVPSSDSFNNDFDTSDFSLDHLNEYIKNSIITTGALESQQLKKKSAVESSSSSSKRSIYEVVDEGVYSVKKFCSTTSHSLSISRDSAIELSPDDSLSHIDHSIDAPLPSTSLNISPTSSSSSSTSPSARKFFKHRAQITERPVKYGRSNFLDHHKRDMFDFDDGDDNIRPTTPQEPADDKEKDEDYVPDKPIGTKTSKLANVTNKTGTEQSKDVSDKGGAKTAAAKKAKAPKGNFRKLTMKKKVMVRGHKKFNMKQYKFKKWKSNKRGKKYDNKCFKCGEADHWANACPNAMSSLPSAVEEGAVEAASSNYQVRTLDQKYDLCLAEPLYTDLDDPELDQLVEESLAEFGFEAFRPNQKLTVKRILCSQSTLLISPTGFGKSLCYQLAAYCFWKKRHLITIVVSPLISLMQDQLLNFPAVLKPVAMNSNQTDKEKTAAINAIIYGHAQVLFLSPECVVSGLHSIDFNAFARVAFVCIDEAHCLAEWSTNFRPSYLHLYKVLRHKLNIRTMLAMTATVTKDTSKMICKNLNLDPVADVVGSTRVPDNLVLTISKKSNKLPALVELLKSEPFKRLKSIIIYCTKREQTTTLETQIRTLLQFETPHSKLNSLVRAYHAGLGAYERTHIQNQFLGGKLRIVVATIAFGMGINKADIRGIIHYNMPKSFENYIQEIGRAGRDGQTAYCHLFLDNEGEDLFGLQNYIYASGVDKPSLKRLVAKIYQPCKCNMLAELDDEEELPTAGTSDQQPEPVKPPKPICAGHPVALPITPTEFEVDIKSENIYTLLMCLELSWPTAPITVYSPTNSTVTIVNFGDEADMYDLVKRSAVVQMGATLTKQECKDAFNFSNFKFSVVKVASMLGKDVNMVKSELRSLEWTTDPITKRKKKSHVSVRFGDYSYLVRAPGNLSEDQIGEVANFLYDTIERYEAKEIYKLRFVYSKFNEFVSTDTVPDPYKIVANSDQLKHFLNDYFQLEAGVIPVDLDSSKLTLPYTFDFENLKEEEAQITLTIAEFIHFYYEQGVNTPRRIARILQGIQSPKYPAQIWGKVRRYWRSQSKMDFKVLMELCREGLVNTYSLPCNDQ